MPGRFVLLDESRFDIKTVPWSDVVRQFSNLGEQAVDAANEASSSYLHAYDAHMSRYASLSVYVMVCAAMALLLVRKVLVRAGAKREYSRYLKSL